MTRDFSKFRFVVSIRDLLSWVQFINTLCSPSETEHTLSPEEAYIHGACLVFIDAIGFGNTAQANSNDIISIRKKFLSYLCSQFGWENFSLYDGDIASNEKYFGLGKFHILKGSIEKFFLNLMSLLLLVRQNRVI